LTYYITDLTPALKNIVQVGEGGGEREREGGRERGLLTINR